MPLAADLRSNELPNHQDVVSYILHLKDKEKLSNNEAFSRVCTTIKVMKHNYIYT